MFHERVPRTLRENLIFRRSLLRQGDADPEVANQLWAACKADPLFFVNAFGWIYEPRTSSSLPWITYEFQDKALRKLIHNITSEKPGRRDIYIEKSRDMGASWMCLTAFVYLWLFFPRNVFIMGSRSEQYVDDTEEPKSLFWKVDFLLNHLPSWLCAPDDYKRNKLRLKNNHNGSIITGESTNKHFARGARATAILLDEFAAVEVDADAVLASSADASKCRIFNSTHLGTGTSFYRVVSNAKVHTPEDVMVLHWKEHPDKRKGLYQSNEFGELQILDKEYPFPEDYNFKLDGKLRSVPYDEECKTRHPREMAQEWDINPVGSDWQYFEHGLIETLQKSTVRPPLWTAEIDYQDRPVQFIDFVPHPNGRFRFWTEFVPSIGPPVDREYGIGIDISEGTGASNSVITVADARTGEQIMEYSDPFIKPAKLAEVAIAVAQCYAGSRGGGFMIWEAQGPGRTFGDIIIKAGYRNVYFRTNETSLSKKQTDSPGWWSTPENKKAEFARWRKAISEGRFTVRSAETLNECLSYIYLANGYITHTLAANSIDPSGAGANHGDRVTAAVLAFKAIAAYVDLVPGAAPEVAPEGSLAWRRENYRKEQAVASAW